MIEEGDDRDGGFTPLGAESELQSKEKVGRKDSGISRCDC